MGCGTGRCGTQTFAKMFGLDHEVQVSPRYIMAVPYKPSTFFVCLKREREACIKSLAENAGFSLARAGDWYDLYYIIAEMFENKFINFRIFDTEELNNPERIEDFIGRKAKKVEPVKTKCDWCTL